MVGTELNHALVISQFAVKTAESLHALPPVLWQGLGSRGKGVADHPLVQFCSRLNKYKNTVKNTCFCKYL
jgi:hypothetical protein